MRIPLRTLAWSLAATASVGSIAHGQCAGTLGELLASNGATFDSFGRSVAAWGDYVVIGAPTRKARGADSGAAYIYRWNGRAWVEEAYLAPETLTPDDLFGSCVAIHGDLAVVGAPGADPFGKTAAGAAYLFRRKSGTWELESWITAPDGIARDQFGSSVATDGTRIAVGAVFDVDRGARSGSVYIFKHQGGGVWTDGGKVLPPDGMNEDEFGRAIAISGDRLLIGAPGKDTLRGVNAGAAYFFRNDGATWLHLGRREALDGRAYHAFGSAVAMEGTTAVVGAPFADDRGVGTGAAYTFGEVMGQWVLFQKLLPDSARSGWYFATSIALENGYLCIGAPAEVVRGFSTGAAHVYKRSGVTWLYQERLAPETLASGDRLGNSVTIAGDRVVIGARLRDARGTDSGAAFAYDLDACADCRADCDGDGRVDLRDWFCYQSLFATGSPLADCDQNFVLDIRDVLCFQAAFARGCP